MCTHAASRRPPPALWRVRIREAASRRRVSAAPDAAAWRREGGVGGGASSERGLFSSTRRALLAVVDERVAALGSSFFHPRDTQSRTAIASDLLGASFRHALSLVRPADLESPSEPTGERERESPRHVAPAFHPFVLVVVAAPPVRSRGNVLRSRSHGGPRKVIIPPPLLSAPSPSAPSAWMVLLVVLVPVLVIVRSRLLLSSCCYCPVYFEPRGNCPIKTLV